MRALPDTRNYRYVEFYRQHLPHLSNVGEMVFLTWRLHGSLPSTRSYPEPVVDSGRAFAALDSLLDETRTGPFYLRQPRIADLVIDAIHYNAQTLRHFNWHSFVVMPNHVHLLITTSVPLSKLTKSLKGITAKRANILLGLTGHPFWQEESYDHLVRSHDEFESIRYYIEQNPVRAGLAQQASDYRWSSAGWTTRGSSADQGTRYSAEI